MPQAFLSPDKTTKFLNLSRYGMTCEPLMESHGEELLMLFLEDSRARTSVWRVMDRGSMENAAACGSTWLEWFAKLDPSGSLWRTRQCFRF